MIHQKSVRASLIHFLVSFIFLFIFSAFVFFFWFPGDLLAIQGGLKIFLMILVIDLILGPLLTLIVYKPHKKSLLFDISVIAFIQLSALFYGAWSLSTQKPAYLVFLHDRFFVVTERDIIGKKKDDIEKIKPWKGEIRPVFVRLSFGAQMSAMTEVPSAIETPALGLLPEAYFDLEEGRSRFIEISQTQNNEKEIIELPLVGRSSRGIVTLDLKTLSIININKQ